MATIVHQVSGDDEVFRVRLENLFDKPCLRRVRFVVAFARWDGLGLLSARIERLLKSGGKFETIYGAGNGVTTTDALYYGLLLKKTYPLLVHSGYVEDVYANACFHPKIYDFLYDGSRTILIGSANLTGGGLCRNTEVGIELSVKDGIEGKVWDEYWKATKKKSETITLQAVRKLATRPGAGREKGDESGGAKIGKPFLKIKGKVAPKPLFEILLDLPKKSNFKGSLLSGVPALSERPETLYLEILERETGGANGNPGDAVQFPVATLEAFFGVGVGEKRTVTLIFDKKPMVRSFIRPVNNTHRLRIPQIRDVPRPGVLILQRVAEDTYEGSFAKNAAVALKKYCNRQTDKRSRRWGLW